MKEHTTIINRIKRVMEYYAENNTDFAKRIGVDKSNFSKMINGQRPIGESIINKIVLTTDFRKAWLWEGEGDPLLEYEEWYTRYAKGKPNEAELVRWYKYRSDIQEDKDTDSFLPAPVVKTEVKPERKQINSDDFLDIIKKRDEQMDKLISLLESQQRTIENLTSQKDTAVTA